MKKLIKDKNNFTSFIISGLLTLLGILMLILPFLEFMEPNKLLYVLFSVYSLVKIIEFIILPKTDDREVLYTAIACALAAISGFKYVSYNTPMVLSITLVSWVGIMSIIKLIKLDYLHDRKTDLLVVNIITFALFLLLGLLTSINLYFNETVQIVVLGFFFVINGLLNLAEVGVKILNSKKKK